MSLRFFRTADRRLLNGIPNYALAFKRLRSYTVMQVMVVSDAPPARRPTRPLHLRAVIHLYRDCDTQLLTRFVDTVRRVDRNAQIARWLAGQRERAPGPNAETCYLVPHVTEPSALRELYKICPGRLPPLFEQFVLTYRWTELDLGICTLLPNELGPDLRPFVKSVTQDAALLDVLRPAGFVQIGWGPDGSYDPMCCRTSGCGQDGDCELLQLGHEEILCNNRAVPVARIARSFRDLIYQVTGTGEAAA